MVEKLLFKKLILFGIKMRIINWLVSIFIIGVFLYLIFKFFEDCYVVTTKVLKKLQDFMDSVKKTKN